MLIDISITYLGKTAKMTVDFDDEDLVDESYERSLGRTMNMDRVMNHFFDNMEVNIDMPGIYK